MKVGLLPREPLPDKSSFSTKASITRTGVSASNILQQLDADMDQTKANIQEYAALKPRERPRNRNLIEVTDTHARSLITLSLDYKQSFFVSLLAMAYWSFARYALYADDRASAHITTMKETVDNFLIKASANFQYLLDRQSPDYRIKVLCAEDPGHLVKTMFPQSLDFTTAG
jgi:hypothetical protein